MLYIAVGNHIKTVERACAVVGGGHQRIFELILIICIVILGGKVVLGHIISECFALVHKSVIICCGIYGA